MKLYEYEAFPNPRRVRMFLAEKGIDVTRVQVNVPAGEHRTPEFIARNPDMAVPLLELDDGSHIAEAVSISRYFEARSPQPSLFGESAQEQASIDMWQRRAENWLQDTVASYFHHATDGLGEADRYRNREWGERNRDAAVDAMQRLDQQLTNNPFIAGAHFSVADITALCAVDFAKALEIEIPEHCEHLRKWHERISARPSAAA